MIVKVNAEIPKLQISYISHIFDGENIQLRHNAHAADIMFKLWDKNIIGLQEEFKIMLLDNKLTIIGVHTLSAGGITGTVVDLSLLFSILLTTISKGFIIFHNHPSGNLKASQADIDITMNIKKASEIFNIKLYDHIIMSPTGEHYSMMSEGIL